MYKIAVTIANVLLALTSLGAWAESFGPPHTNVVAIANAETIVAGYVVDTRATLLSELTGNADDAKRAVTFVQFQVSEVLSGTHASPGENIQLNIIGGEAAGVTTPPALTIPDANSQVVFALRRDTGGTDNFKNTYVPQNARTIFVDSETTLAGMRNQIQKIQTADPETFQQMITAEWEANGIDPTPYIDSPDTTDDTSEYDPEAHYEDDPYTESVEVLDYDPDENLVPIDLKQNKKSADNTANFYAEVVPEKEIIQKPVPGTDRKSGINPGFLIMLGLIAVIMGYAAWRLAKSRSS